MESHYAKRHQLSGLINIIALGVKWSVTAQTVIQFTKIGRWLLLLYLIEPVGFGLFALASLLVSLPQILLDQGVGSAIIQSEKSFSRIDLSTYFWLLSGFCFLLLVLSLVTAPLIANFFSEPQLTTLLIFIHVAFFFESFGKVSGALLRKRLRFSYIAKVETSSFLLATSIVIVFAYLGHSYWALAYGLLFEYTFIAVCNLVGASFFPVFSFSARSLKKVYVFTKNISLIHFTSLLMRYIDDLIIGFFFGKAALGIYDRAYQIVHLPMRLITNRIVMVLFPAYSQKGTEKQKIRKIHLRVIHYSAILYFFILGGIILCTKYAVVIFLPKEWNELTFFIPVLALGGVIHAFINYNYSIFLAFNRTDLQLRYGLVTRSIIISSYLIGAFWGVKGIAIGYVFGSLLSFYPESKRAWQELDISFRDFRETVSTPFIYTLSIFVSVFIITLFFESDLIKLLVGSILYSIFFLIIYQGKFKEITHLLSEKNITN